MDSRNLLMAVLGNGEIAKKTVVALLADHVTNTAPHFLLPVTAEHYTPAVRSAAEWALKHSHPYEVVIDGTEDEIEDIAPILNGALVTHKVAAVEAKLVALLAQHQPDPDAMLVLAWNDTDDACQLAATPHAAASIC